MSRPVTRPFLMVALTAGLAAAVAWTAGSDIGGAVAPQSLASALVFHAPFGGGVDARVAAGLNYVGLLDELAVFNRRLTATEVGELHRLDRGIASLAR